jgi:hypothetical protein
VFAAFQIGGRDAAIDSGARRKYRYDTHVPYIAVTDQVHGISAVVAISVVGLWPVAVFAAGVLGVNFLAATAAVYRPTSASATSAILKSDPGKKVHHRVPPRINRLTLHACTFTQVLLIVSILLLILFLFPTLIGFFTLFSLVFFLFSLSFSRFTC